MLPNRPFTHKAFCCRKANAQHSVSNCVRGVLTVQALGQEYGLQFFRESVEGFREKGWPFLWKTLDLFPVGSKFPPFLYVLTIFLQMKAHDVLHKTWKVSSSTPKSHEKSLSIVFVGNTRLKWFPLALLSWPCCNHAKWSYLILFLSLSFWCKSRILICKLF